MLAFSNTFVLEVISQHHYFLNSKKSNQYQSLSVIGKSSRNLQKILYYYFLKPLSAILKQFMYKLLLHFCVEIIMMLLFFFLLKNSSCLNDFI